MISKQELKFIRSLSQKKFRDENSMFIIEGEKLLYEAEKSGATILKIFHRDTIGEENMSRISLMSTPSPVLAIVKMPDIPTYEINPGKLYLALDSVKDPGNLGTIIRIADWYGIDDIFISPGSVELYNPKCVQASMGAIFRVKAHYLELKSFIEKNKKIIPVYGTFLHAPSIYDANIENRGIIVLGSESDGISDEVSMAIDNRIKIPPFPVNSERGESLNVAVATAIICSEFRRLSAS